MGLLSFLHRPGAAPAARPGGDAVREARARARRRLIGASVLVGLGVIGFPLLFETQPRPIPVDIPIEIPRKDAAPPLAPPAPRPAASMPRAGVTAPAPTPTPARRSEVITETRVEARREVAPPAAAPAVVAPAAAPAASAKTVAKAAPAPAAETTPAASAASARVVVQVGAFADPNAARETRQRVEKLGLKTYTQDVEVDGAKRTRVRIGPFASREEADKVADKVKAAGLPAAVLAL